MLGRMHQTDSDKMPTNNSTPLILSVYPGCDWAEEEFVKTYLPWLNQLNLRATYGVQGNVVTSISPDLITQYQGILPGYNEYYLTISSLPNPLLKWGTDRKTWNLGTGSTII